MRIIVTSIVVGACALGALTLCSGCSDGYASQGGGDGDRLNQAFNSKRAPEGAPGAAVDRGVAVAHGPRWSSADRFDSKRAPADRSVEIVDDGGAIGGSSSGSLGSDHEFWSDPQRFDSKRGPADSDRVSHPVIEEPAGVPGPSTESGGYPYWSVDRL